MCLFKIAVILPQKSESPSVYYAQNFSEPRKIVNDKLRGYPVAHRELLPDVIRSSQKYENNRVKQSYEATR